MYGTYHPREILNEVIVLARVFFQHFLRQLSAGPGLVERMLEHAFFLKHSVDSRK
jgi:hypothetical protein